MAGSISIFDSDSLSFIEENEIEFNEEIESNPELVNSDPYGEGWMIKIKMSDTSELDSLLNAEDI